MIAHIVLDLVQPAAASGRNAGGRDARFDEAGRKNTRMHRHARSHFTSSRRYPQRQSPLAFIRGRKERTSIAPAISR